jgi:hypothetical protein
MSVTILSPLDWGHNKTPVSELKDVTLKAIEDGQSKSFGYMTASSDSIFYIDPIVGQFKILKYPLQSRVGQVNPEAALMPYIRASLKGLT